MITTFISVRVNEIFCRFWHQSSE